MKNDAVEFDTSKSLSEISKALNSFKCEVTQIEKKSLEQYQGTYPKIAVVMVGRATMKDAFQHFGTGKSEWGVQVFIYDLGRVRHVELIALGESGLRQALYAYGKTGGRLGSGYGRLSNEYINFTHSKTYRDRMAELLQDAEAPVQETNSGNAGTISSAPKEKVSIQPATITRSFADEADAVDTAFNNGTYPEGSMQNWMVNGALQSWFNIVFDKDNTRASWVSQGNTSLWDISFMGWKVAHFGLYDQQDFAAWKQIKETADSITKPAAEKCTKEFNAATTNPFTDETFVFDGWLLEHFERTDDDDKAIWDYCLGKNGTLYVITTHINTRRSEFKYKVNEILYLSSQMFRPFSCNSYVAITNGWIEAFNTVPIVPPASRIYTIPSKDEKLIYNFPIEIARAEDYPYDGLNGLLNRLVALLGIDDQQTAQGNTVSGGGSGSEAGRKTTPNMGKAVPFSMDDYVLFAAKTFSKKPYAQTQNDFISNPDSPAFEAFRTGRLYAADSLTRTYPGFQKLVDMILNHEAKGVEGEDLFTERQLATDIANKCDMPPLALVLLGAYAALLSVGTKDESVSTISGMLVDRACRVEVSKDGWEELIVSTMLWFSNKDGFKDKVIKKFYEIKDTPEYNYYDRSKVFSDLVKCGINLTKGQDDLDGAFSNALGQHREAVALSVAEKYPEFKKVTALIAKTNAEIDQTSAVFAENFAKEFAAEWEFAKDENVKNDSDFHVLLAAMTASADDLNKAEQKDATHLLDIILERDEQIFGIAQISLLVAAMWYADYKNYRHYITIGTLPEDDKPQPSTTASGQTQPRMAASQAQVKPAQPDVLSTQAPTLKYAPDSTPPMIDLEDIEDTEFTRTKQLAEAGNADAERKLGVMYLKGELTDKDKNEGLRWLKKAGTDGDQEAQTILINLAKKNVTDFQGKFQLVQSFGEKIASDPQKAREETEEGTSYAQAYREIVRFLPVSEKSQLRFLLFCFKLQPSVLFCESGCISADFLIREMDSYIAAASPQDAGKFVNSIAKIDWNSYVDAEIQDALEYREKTMPREKANWSKVAAHVSDISGRMESGNRSTYQTADRQPQKAGTVSNVPDRAQDQIIPSEHVRQEKRISESRPVMTQNRTAKKATDLMANPQVIEYAHLGLCALVFLSLFNRSAFAVLLFVALEIAARSLLCRLNIGKPITIAALERIPILQNISITTRGLIGFALDFLACTIHMSFAWGIILAVVIREAAKYFAATR